MKFSFPVILLAGLVAMARSQGQLFDKTTLEEAKTLLTNKDYVNTACQCITSATDEKCDPNMKKIKTTIPEVIEKQDCPTACNAYDKQIVSVILETMNTKYPECRDQILTHFKTNTPEAKKKLEDFVAANKPPA